MKIESQQQPQLQQQIEWRRSKVLELDSQGHSQPEIARILQVSVGTQSISEYQFIFSDTDFRQGSSFYTGFY